MKSYITIIIGMIYTMTYPSLADDEVNPFEEALSLSRKHKVDAKNPDRIRTELINCFLKIEKDEKIQFLNPVRGITHELSSLENPQETKAFLESVRIHAVAVEETEAEVLSVVTTSLIREAKMKVMLLFYDSANKPEKASFLRIETNNGETFEFELSRKKCPDFFKFWMALQETK
jgi:hypothetical protein